MDCKAAKEFLSKKGFPYYEINLSTEPEKEQELVRLTGTRIVPAFIFEKKGILTSKKTVLIGFEQNQDQIEDIIESNLK
ncbi:glutaredoxin family protein [Mesobacillus foraminis]|uniref:glutaredoxin family protein n=1 Tax=Mesobacillus foraminis TaxID=279826 RepID=UPI0020361066|nr:glutaredoxin domain-containing protein [Mesobacillus foraminis]